MVNMAGPVRASHLVLWGLLPTPAPAGAVLAAAAAVTATAGTAI